MRVTAVDAAVTRPLRLAVLRPGLGPGSLVDPDGAIHLAAWDDDRVVGAAVLETVPLPSRPRPAAMRLRGMAVDPQRQRGGIGGLLLDAVLDTAARSGADLVWCHARVTARGFYARHGYRAEGDEFVGAMQLPHVVMWRPVEPTGAAVSSTP